MWEKDLCGLARGVFPDPPASVSWVLGGQAGTTTPRRARNRKEKGEC